MTLLLLLLLLLLGDGVVATVVGVAIIDADAADALRSPSVVHVVLSFSSCLMGVNHCSWRVVAAAADAIPAPLLAELLLV